ncbi:MAG: terpene cyclase/mutase family protein [Planctomycetaceae bacterium]|nr:terpene cyclase/mutase family protein [Planctomycetaceae bacterium]
MRRLLMVVVLSLSVLVPCSRSSAQGRDPKVDKAVSRALDYLAREQRRQGHWEANNGQYKVAMTALAGIALLAEGSTTTRGKYAKNVADAVDYLLDMSQENGLIGYKDDYRYTYGHGFSMLFLSQVFGEEEDIERRENIQRVLTKAVEFCGYAQTDRGGWGYVSAKDGNNFDEGSTCITQVQGLRACRNAGIPVPADIIERAKQYIADCTTEDGGVQYSIMRQGGPRPPITAAAVAALFNSGEYEGENVKNMLAFCEKNIWPGGGGMQSTFGHWHYAHYYYAQVMYRLDEDKWTRYSREISDTIIRKQSADGSWQEGHVGPVYTTAMNATILQLDKGYLPIFQR